MRNVGNVISAMIEYYAGDVRRINHFLKVYGFAKAIGEMEKLSPLKQEILEVASVVHDIGIKNSEIKYNSSAGNYQQIEGPPVAEEMLKKLGYEDNFIKRVCFLIAHHHTYTDIDNYDYQILVEADFLVNIDEDQLSMDVVRSVKEKIFRTEVGIKYLNVLYNIDNIGI
ncbi:HD domain-containing protein [Clostridium cellulovorans]|uniref:Metal-dependent phosphohydrolase HD sub domain n=1 Tax=Clostridium cellulovorans (strain ATCC 35296 / DSM 3052 / OCM 3 / 743B) TaxID=573061 RepID=D9SR22_CLOC7|nr:HD domain-containing protein [Clostridium cellulovorans]ADL50310.1 metal-dependent phosphohydrolase HD sub domain [Clostridium cellulovorans 743B]